MLKRLRAEAKAKPIEAFVCLCAIGIFTYTMIAIVQFIVGVPPK